MATLAERAEDGRERRTVTPADSFATWTPASDRGPALERLTAGDVTRIPELVPIRYGRMVQSPFAFLRGSAVVMAADLASAPTAGLRVQLCGDAHLLNFGGFATPERNLVFDVNDFDETIPGPFEWDVARLAASVAVAGRWLGADDATNGRGARRTVKAYCRAMAEYAEHTVLEIWYARIDAAEVATTMRHLPPTAMTKLAHKARSHTSAHLLPRLADLTAEGGRIRHKPPLVVSLPSDVYGDIVTELMETYRESLRDAVVGLLDRLQVADVAHKVVGVGSVGTRCLIVLLFGRDHTEPVFLQVKEANASVLAPYVGDSAYEHQGRRVVEGQRAIQAASDVFLGWATGGGGHAYVRQLRDMKLSPDLARLDRPSFDDYARLCGRTLARAHARTGDPVAIAAYLDDGDEFARAIGSFAVRYADVTIEDHAALEAAVADGTIVADRDH
jgi:uncharacterized protein (DUF2252 family)